MIGPLARIKSVAGDRLAHVGGATKAKVKERLVVIGNGMVGFKLLELIDRRGLLGDYEVTVFGAEPQPAMDRVNLTEFLHDTSAEDLVLADRSWYEERSIELFTGDPVVLVDREERVVHSRGGRRVAYDRLVFATGSRAFLPDMPGRDLEGVYVYRELADLQRIRQRAADCDSVLVIGGGLLGLEAAEAFHKMGLRTHVVERGSGLMSKQLPAEASVVLQRQVEAMGVIVHNGQRTESVEPRGDELVVAFKSGFCVKVGMVVFATGIRPRDELAKACGLELGPRGGIQINDQLQTSDPNIHAVGDCASHNGTVYGLVLPGYEMAEVLVECLAGRAAKFKEADQSAILKLEGIEVAAVGEYQADCPSHSNEGEGIYRRISVRNGRIVGAVGIGDWTEMSRVRETIRRRRRIWPWNVNRFVARGLLWRPATTADPGQWPATAEVCNCMGVSKGEIVAACAAGCRTVREIADRTGASTVCGSCQPVVARLAGAPAVVAAPPKAGGWLLATSIVAALLSLALVAFEIPFAKTVGGGWKLETLWTDHFLKQVTGFALVGAALLSMVLSLRKRIKRFKLGDFGYWRVLHTGLGVLTLALLVTHTGLHLGHQLNFLLMLNFLLLAFFGALAGGLTALERRLDGATARMLRRGWVSLHIVLTWPLPVLIFFHAFASYYY